MDIGGIGGMFNHFADQGVDLNSISDLQNRYNNLEKELQTSNNLIKNRNDYNTQRPLIQDQERKLAEDRNRQNQIAEQNRKQLKDEQDKRIQNSKRYQIHYNDETNHANYLKSLIHRYNSMDSTNTQKIKEFKEYLNKTGFHTSNYGYLHDNPSDFTGAGDYKQNYLDAVNYRKTLNKQIGDWYNKHR